MFLELVVEYVWQILLAVLILLGIVILIRWTQYNWKREIEGKND